MQTYITAAGPAQVSPESTRSVAIQVNGALTGTITVKDSTSDDTGPIIAVITNPTGGSRYTYGDFKRGVRIIPSATCDLTVLSRSRY